MASVTIIHRWGPTQSLPLVILAVCWIWSAVEAQDAKEETSVHSSDPYFESTTSINKTVPLGKVAYLPCVVQELGTHIVSWIRKRDLHLLSVGRYMSINDQRFKVLGMQNHWTLQIRYTQQDDEGLYLCQLNTNPSKSLLINLTIVVPTATILGSPELYFNSGSTINLTCIVTNVFEPPTYVFWFHNSTVLNFYSRERINVAVDAREKTTSTLTISNAKTSDSGNYSCNPSTTNATSITVHVYDPKVVIPGPPDIYLKSGSTIKLSCVISPHAEPPEFIFWYHENRVINYYSTSTAEVSMETAKYTTIAKLSVLNAQLSNSGNYTCSPTNVDSRSVMVHVLNDSTSSLCSSACFIGLINVILVTCYDLFFV